MRGAVIYGPGDVRFEEREDPKIVEPTDAIVQISATCAHSSDFGHPFRLKADAVPAENGQARGRAGAYGRVQLSNGPADGPSHLTGYDLVCSARRIAAFAQPSGAASPALERCALGSARFASAPGRLPACGITKATPGTDWVVAEEPFDGGDDLPTAAGAGETGAAGLLVEGRSGRPARSVMHCRRPRWRARAGVCASRHPSAGAGGPLGRRGPGQRRPTWDLTSRGATFRPVTGWR